MEEWKDIPGYEGRYQASTYGRIKSLQRYIPTNKHWVKEKILTPRKSGKDYRLQVALYIDGVQKQYYVSRLIAETFIPNPYNYPEVNHKDEDYTNNTINNLEWCNSSYNSNYGNRTYKIMQANIINGTYQQNRRRLNKPIAQYTINEELIGIYESALQAAQYNHCSNQMIGRCANGKVKTYHGYIWRFYE